MARLVVRRRPDGLIQLRRRRAWNLVADPVLGVLCLLFPVCAAVMIGLATALVAGPFLVGVVAACLALGLLAARWARTAAPATVPVLDPPPRRAA